jgi:hypothetical protein
LVGDGLEAAVARRTENFHDLVWGREEARFELAVEAAIPDEHLVSAGPPRYGTIRYEKVETLYTPY